jgi:hypothetical protein
MRNFLLLSATTLLLFSCKQKKDDDKKNADTKKDKVEKTASNEYTVTNDGVGELKIGMKHTEVEKLLNEKFTFRSIVDAPGYWSDTMKTKYKGADVSLIFERMNGSSDSSYMELYGVETTSSLCKTEYGVGIGDDRAAILEPYEDRTIWMGPEYEMVNDTTWEASKIKYMVSISDEKSGRNIVFHLVNKKVASLGCSIAMGE